MNIRQALFHNTVWRVAAMSLSFVNNILIVRLLGAEAGATFFYTVAALTLLSTFLRFGLENGIVYFGEKFPDRIGALIIFITAIALLQTAAAWLCIRYFIGGRSVFPLFWSVAYVMLTLLVYYATSFFQVKRMYISINVSSTTAALLQTFALLYFFFGNENAFISRGLAGNLDTAVLIVLTLTVFLQVFFLTVYFFSRNRSHLFFMFPAASLVSGLFKYSFINFVAAVMMFLIIRADFYFVQKYCSVVVLANYVQVAKFGQLALLFPSMLGGVIFPYSVNAANSFPGKIAFFCRALTLLFFTGIIFFAAIGPFVFTGLLGADYSLVYSGLCLTAAGVYALAINLILISYFEGKDRQRIILLSNLIVLLLIIAGDSYVVPAYGYRGAAVVFSAANVVGMIIMLARFVTTTGISVKNIFLFRPNDLTLVRSKKKNPGEVGSYL